METPFNIGDVMWLPRTHPTRTEVACPVCYGARSVVMTLGNLDRVTVGCENCGKGYEGPRGSVEEYTYEASVEQFTIKAIESMHGGRWYLKSTFGACSDFGSLFTDKELAQAESARAMAAILEHNARYSAARTKHMREQACWTIGYHEKCIREYEQKIAYHRSKVSERRATEKKGKRPSWAS